MTLQAWLQHLLILLHTQLKRVEESFHCGISVSPAIQITYQLWIPTSNACELARACKVNDLIRGRQAVPDLT